MRSTSACGTTCPRHPWTRKWIESPDSWAGSFTASNRPSTVPTGPSPSLPGGLLLGVAQDLPVALLPLGALVDDLVDVHRDGLKALEVVLLDRFACWHPEVLQQHLLRVGQHPLEEQQPRGRVLRRAHQTDAVGTGQHRLDRGRPGDRSAGGDQLVNQMAVDAGRYAVLARAQEARVGGVAGDLGGVGRDPAEELVDLLLRHALLGDEVLRQGHVPLEGAWLDHEHAGEAGIGQVLIGGGRVLHQVGVPRDREHVQPGAGPAVLHRGVHQALAGLLPDYDGPAREGLVDAAMQDGWTGTRLNVFTVSWNTDLVQDPPTSYEDLADPRFAGVLMIEPRAFEWYMSLSEYFIAEEGMTQEEVDELFSGIAANATQITGNTAHAGFLGAGEYGVSTSVYSHLVDELIASGAPISRTPAVEPVLTRPNGVGLMCTAQNPASGLLFFEWVLTDAQEMLLEDFRVPARESVQQDNLQGLELISLDIDQVINERAEWEERYGEILRNAEAEPAG